MPRIAIFDDYQNVALELADWSPVTERATVTVFNDHLSEAKDIVDRLRDFDAVCVMRERTPLTRDILEGLPRLKLIVSSRAARCINRCRSGGGVRYRSHASLSQSCEPWRVVEFGARRQALKRHLFGPDGRHSLPSIAEFI